MIQNTRAASPADPHCPWLELCEEMEKRLGAIIADQQRIIEEQQALITELSNKLADKDREHEGRVLALETEVARLTRELCGRKGEKLEVPSGSRARARVA